MIPASAAHTPAHGRAPLLQVPEQRARARPSVPQGARAAVAALQDGSNGEQVLSGPRADLQPRAVLHVGGGDTAASTARNRLLCTRGAALSHLYIPSAADDPGPPARHAAVQAE